MSDKQNEALRSLAKNISPEDAAKLLDSLRWSEDRVITNHEGERVWLKVLYDGSGKRIGITDCCLEESPCERHAEMVKAKR
jgi:hypothetical protein